MNDKDLDRQTKLMLHRRLWLGTPAGRFYSFAVSCGMLLCFLLLFVFAANHLTLLCLAVVVVLVLLFFRS
jgi:hypothetical protein